MGRILDGERSEAGMSTQPNFIQSSYSGFGRIYEERRMGRDEIGRGKDTLMYADDSVDGRGRTRYEIVDK